MMMRTVLPPLLAVLLAPLLLGITNRVKAVFAGRQGPPLLQLYHDLARLLRKSPVYSRTTTLVFRIGPMIGLAALLTACLLMPLGNWPAPLAFSGDFILFAYLLGLARLFTVLAALDTGSAFEGMGASRELMFSALAEPTLLVALAALAHESRGLSLSGFHGPASPLTWGASGLVLALVAVALFVVFLAENSRMPVDDPNTHLELTMIHEVMVLDHSGPDLAFILYSAALKLWLLGALIVGAVCRVRSGLLIADLGFQLLGLAVVAVLVGVIESMMARLRLVRVPELLVGATVLAALALMIGYGGPLR
jgi:formate hydrogenlyase subunit 4